MSNVAPAAHPAEEPGFPARKTFARRLRAWVPWIVFLAVAIAAMVAYLAYAKSHQPPDVVFKTASVETRRIVARVTATGTLQAVVTVQVGSQVSGRVQHLFADFNSVVKKGERVAKIDPQLFQAAVAQARASSVSAVAALEKAKAQSLDADRQYERTKRLAGSGLATTTDVETAETTAIVAKAQIDVARAAVDQARAALNQAQVNLSYTDIVSPIEGIVISRNVDVGQTVAASLQAPTLFTIAEDLRKMQVNTNVAEGDVGRLVAGQEATFTVDAFPGEKFSGTISQIRNAPQTLQNVVTYDAVIDVDNADQRLRPGMTANVTVVVDAREAAVAVPNAALRFKPPPQIARAAPTEPKEEGTRTLWLLDGDKARAVSVRLGLSDGTWTEVLSREPKPGEKVITDATANSSAPAPTGGGGQLRRIM